MIFKINAEISAVGGYVPEKRLTNDDLSKIVDTSDEWIFSRTGIKERRISEKNEFTSTLAIRAVQDLIDNNDISVDDVDFIITSTITQDYYTPGVAALVQGYFKIKNTGSIDINSACSGYVNGLQVAFSMITSGQFKKVLLITADTLSKIVDYKDRSTCVLFGDAATATIIQLNDKVNNTCHSFAVTNGLLGKDLYCSSVSNIINGVPIASMGVIHQNGRALYSFVTRDISNMVNDYLNSNNIPINSIDWLIPHSANARMISKFCEHIGCSDEKTLLSLEMYGNTSSNSIPLSLWNALKINKIKKNDRIFLLGFGGGFTCAGLIFNF